MDRKNKFKKRGSMKISLYARNMIGLSEKDDFYLQGKKDFVNYRFKQASVKDSESSYHFQDIERIKDSIFKSLVKQLPNDKEKVLLLSDGKDSLTIALAMHKLGVKFTTLTLLKDDDVELKEYLVRVTSSLGVSSFFYNVTELLDSYSFGDFVDHMSNADYPIMDQAYLFFYLGVKKFLEDKKSNDDFCFIDGMGNDEYFGHMPNSNQLKSFALSKLKLHKLTSNRKLRFYLRTEAESQGILSALSFFYDIQYSLDLEEYFRYAACSVKNKKDLMDFRAFSRGQFLDKLQMSYKTKLAASSLNQYFCFPWEEEEVSDIIFNLPQNLKFDLKGMKNKIILRLILESEIGWNQSKRGVDLYEGVSIETLLHLSSNVPEKAVDIIVRSKMASLKIKKRALLEIVNLYSYMKAKGFSNEEFLDVLGL